jgi:hypothetical protein
VVEVVVAVDEVLDRLVGDLADFLDVRHRCLRAAVGDRVGGDDACPGHHEHRLVVAVAEDVDVIGISWLFSSLSVKPQVKHGPFRRIPGLS